MMKALKVLQKMMLLVGISFSTLMQPAQVITLTVLLALQVINITPSPTGHRLL